MCGAEQAKPLAAFDLRARCAGSPLCDRCGHPRSGHAGVFVRGVGARCCRPLGDFQSLSRYVCDCAGFRPIAGPLRDASFAEAVEPTAPLPRLRGGGARS
jgi:hypothetical protein